LFFNVDRCAQTFTVGSSEYNITSVKLKMFRTAFPGTMYVNITTTDGNGHPTWNNVTSGEIETDNFTSSSPGAWYQINVTSYALQPNTKYAIVCMVYGGPSNWMNWRADGSSPTYSGGNLEYSDTEGATWTSSTTKDLMFEVWGTLEEYPYNYVVHGPFYEDGSVANKVVNVTLERMVNSSYKFQLNGTDGSADTVEIELVYPGVAFTWNITDPAYNRTRTFYLTSATFEEIWIYLPPPDEPCYLYTFTVTDFVGVTNAYLETVKNVGGQNRIVERQALNVLGPVPFWLVWANKYDIRLICDQGMYTWGGFIALTEQSQSLIITVGMFPLIYAGMNVTVTAQRRNATWIQITYTDYDELTLWVNVQIVYLEDMAWTTAYSENKSGSAPDPWSWYDAEAKVDYVANVTSMYDGEKKTWQFNLPAPPATVNPWEGLLEALGNWPIPAKNVIGLILVLMVFGVFSYYSMPTGCVLGVLTAGFLTYIGWLDLSWNLIALAGAVSIFAVIAKAKREEREL